MNTTICCVNKRVKFDLISHRIAQLIAERWNSTLPVPQDMTASLTNVRIPCNVQDKRCYSWDIEKVLNHLREKYDLWVIIYSYMNTRYARISCQIYNELSEYK